MSIILCPLRYFTRLFILILIIYAITLFYTYHNRLNDIRANRKDISYLNHKELKYILQWTRRFSAPFDYMGEGNSAFVKYNCKYRNCFVTDDKNYFLNQSDFNAIAFNGRDVNMWAFQLPKDRSPKQKYIFGAMESPDFFPACNDYLDGYFNWTWTYKLDSDFQWGYISIYDVKGNLVGPAIDMKWVENMDPVDEKLRLKLSKKRKAVAWFVSHCSTKRHREDYVEEFSQELNKFGWTVDIYGRCGTLSCPLSESNSCFRMIEDDYHFYLSFENSFAEDYVTEKLLTALNNYAVPVVYGGADYSRFLPEGSYLDAINLGPKKLAETIFDIMGNKTRYYEFFRWRNHYVYRDADHLNACRLCEMMNRNLEEKSVWKYFRTWWNGVRYEENCL
ncbi:alpha-(1,3)-fucosyltransferase C-like [Colias croceus]|uniref:alpha-(1,3)-fucosyltransferase C-like n=1 Tax=Colias crocea TaxID=72248 RepID=UPI001E27C7B3|nr:alpha-(1,3)-fucosyltransferase C-like [Colias croceus]